MPSIKNIIFDLGGVLLNIDYSKTIHAFEALGHPQFEVQFSQTMASPLFEDLETGRITEDDFLTHISARLNKTVTNQQIITAWNAMILDFRTDCLPVLESLSRHYQLYLLSNTNIIHLKYFREIFTRDTGKPALEDYFIKAWYSHEIGLRKPHREIYEFALKEGKMVAGETLFIDDLSQNIEGAKTLGIQTRLLQSGEGIAQVEIGN